MRRPLFFVVLLLSPAVSFGVEPKAAVRGPASARAGTVVRLDLAGTVSDPVPSVKVWKGPDVGTPMYAADGSFVGYELPKPGAYTFIVVASGSAAGSPSYAVAFCDVQVSPDGPPPGPIPAPSPSPNGLTPAPSPPSDPFAAAFRVYVGGMPSAIASASADVRSGKTATKQAFLDAIHAHSVPFASALDALFAPNIDSTSAGGRITNPAAVSDAIDAAVKGSP